MKKSLLLLAIGIVGITWFVLHFNSNAAEGGTFQKYEYVTIRWAGRDNTHLIRSNGKVEMLGTLLNRVTRPDRVDDRAFYMNIAMNSVAKEGYELAGITSDEIVMKRATQ